MYGKSLEDAISPPGGIGTPPLPAADDPMSSLLSGKAKVQQQTPEAKYHQQRMDVLSMLKRALDKGGVPNRENTDSIPGNVSPQDAQAEKALDMFLEIYSKLPGGTNTSTKSGNETPFFHDAKWADNASGGIGGYPGTGPDERYDFGKDNQGRMK